MIVNGTGRDYPISDRYKCKPGDIMSMEMWQGQRSVGDKGYPVTSSRPDGRLTSTHFISCCS